MSDQTGEAGSVPKESVPVVPAYVERRENCPRYIFAGGVWIVLADEAQTSGNITNMESIYSKAAAFRGSFTSEKRRWRTSFPEPGAMVFVPRGVARKFTADMDETRVYHGFVPAGFEQLLVEHSAKTELMTVPIGEAPFDRATATMFGTDIVPE